MAPDLRDIRDLELFRDYREADPAGRAVLLREIRTGRREAVIGAAQIAIRVGDHEALRALLDAAPLTDPDERATRAAMLAHLELSHGRATGAAAHIAELERLDDSYAPLLRAGYALLPFAPVTETRLRASLSAMEQADFSVPPGTEDHSPRRTRPVQRLYYLGALHARLGDTDAARAYATQIETMSLPATWDSYAAAHATSLRARIAVAEDRPDEALRLLEGNELIALDANGAALDIDRYIRIELLLEAGRAAEAMRWIEHSLGDMGTLLVSPALAYHAVREQLRGRAHELLGEHDEAIAAYTRFLDLWRDADPEYAGLIRSARQRRDALVAARS